MPDLRCPCQSGKSYRDCCESYHLGAIAPSPEALMRSRYSAYALNLLDYVHASWHADTRPTSLLEEQSSGQSVQQSVQQSPQQSVQQSTQESPQEWKGLQVFSSGAEGDNGAVHFCAVCRENGCWHALEERSRFVCEAGRWYYLDGDTEHRALSPGRNDPCPCGSGRKAKKCCGV